MGSRLVWRAYTSVRSRRGDHDGGVQTVIHAVQLAHAGSDDMREEMKLAVRLTACWLFFMAGLF